MAHLHSVYDTDSHFSINIVTRALKNEASSKVTVMQYDHNSERFTFEIPRTVEGHDMSLCNRVEVHYQNGANSDVYEVDDLQVSPNGDDVVICSWLISQNATQNAAALDFRLTFKCVADDGTIEYCWSTAMHKGISVSSGINNSEIVAKKYVDVLEQWKKDMKNATCNIPRIETAVNGQPMINLRDLESGSYILYGSFEPYAGSNTSLSADNSLISVCRKDGASHIVCLDPLNAKVVFFEVSVDETQESGFTYTRKTIYLFDLNYDGGGSGVDVQGATPGQMIIVKSVDENGKPTEWEAVDRTHYSEFETQTLLEETTLVASEETEGGALIPHAIDLSGIAEIEVTYNGVTYNCPVTGMDEDGDGTNDAYVFGDLSMFGDDIASTGEPFVGVFYSAALVEMSGMTGLIVPLDGSTEFTVSIVCNKETVHTIPEKYLPNTSKSNNLIVELTYNNADSQGNVNCILSKTASEIANAAKNGVTVVAHFTFANSIRIFNLCSVSGQDGDMSCQFACFEITSSGLDVWEFIADDSQLGVTITRNTIAIPSE